jgi:hypothetical protein
MRADEAILLIQSMEPQEIERLLVLMKEYEAELRRHPVPPALLDQAKLSNAPSLDPSLSKLAAMERREREAQSNME